MGEPRPPIEDVGTLIWYPEARHGRPCLAGTGISVKRMIYLHRMGDTPEATADDYDVPVSHVYAALALYYANKNWFDEILREEEAENERLYQQWLAEQPARAR